jgi:transcriptional regulator
MTLYRPTHFRVDDEAELFAFMQRHAFATLVCDGDAGLVVSHIPFLPMRDAGGGIRLLGHFARANPQFEALQKAPHVLAIFQGPHAYVSPTWYTNHPSVPTWNYSVVHAHGRVRTLEESELRELVDQLSRTYEGDRADAWRLAAQPEEFVSKMLRAISGFEMQVERLEGKFKLSQNRPEEIGRVAAALETQGEGDVAEMMRAHAPKPRSTIPS